MMFYVSKDEAEKEDEQFDNERSQAEPQEPAEEPYRQHRRW